MSNKCKKNWRNFSAKSFNKHKKTIEDYIEDTRGKDICVSWYNEMQYNRLLEIADDADYNLQKTFHAWEENAEELESKIQSKCYRFVRVYVNVDELAQWCKERNCLIDSHARAAYAVEQLNNVKLKKMSTLGIGYQIPEDEQEGSVRIEVFGYRKDKQELILKVLQKTFADFEYKIIDTSVSSLIKGSGEIDLDWCDSFPRQEQAEDIADVICRINEEPCCVLVSLDKTHCWSRISDEYMELTCEDSDMLLSDKKTREFATSMLDFVTTVIGKNVNPMFITFVNRVCSLIASGKDNDLKVPSNTTFAGGYDDEPARIEFVWDQSVDEDDED